MRFNCCCSLTLVLTAGVIASGSTVLAQDSNPGAPAVSPQIVRLTYVEGDVRISRGKQADKLYEQQQGETTGWEKAVTGLPIRSGYSIVTGTDGRAAIELEDASVVYLADKSVLKVGELISAAGAPLTSLALLSGTATIDVKLVNSGAQFFLKTPTDTVQLAYPQQAYLRVNSYFDALVLTPRRDLSFVAPATSSKEEPSGRSFAFRSGKRILLPPQIMRSSYGAWDNWVDGQVRAREAANAAAMKQAGLKEPLPGLADLEGKGRFFECQPYGTCWEPAKGWDGQGDWTDDKAQTISGPVQSNVAPGNTARPAPKKKQHPGMIDVGDAYEQAHPGAYLYTEDYTFPCSRLAVQDLIARDPVTGKEKIIDSRFDTRFLLANAYYPDFHWGNFWGWEYDADWNQYPWQWAVCHAGSWIRWQHHYVWVAGYQRHYSCPVRWIHNGHQIGYVPIHPHDVPGKTPLNLKHGLMTVTDKKSGRFTRVDFDSSHPAKVLDRPPREFRKPALEHLTRVEPPHPMAHSIYAINVGQHSTPLADQKLRTGTAIPGRTFVEQRDAPIDFNRKQQAFTITRTPDQTGHRAPLTFSGRPEAFQARFEQRQQGGYSANANGSTFGAGGNTGSWSGPSSSNSYSAGLSGASSSQGSSPAAAGGGSSGPAFSGGGSSAGGSSGLSSPSGGRGDATVSSR
jgi:hypothetical protein